LFDEIVHSIISYSKAFVLLFRFRLYKYLLLLLLLLIIFAFPVVIFDFFIQLLTGFIPYAEAQKYASIPVQIAAGFSGFFLLLVLSPVFSLVSEETGQKLSGKNYHFSPGQFIKDIIRGIKITLRNMLYQYLFIALISIAMYFLPEMKIIHITGNVLIFIVTAYFYGFSILDYAMENLRMSYKKSIDFVRNHPGIAIGLGSIYYAIISINNIPSVNKIFGNLNIYWSNFAEAIIAFIGVIAASYIMYAFIPATKKRIK
jgi:CysZ protein